MRPEEKASEACRHSSPPRAPELREGLREWKQERGLRFVIFFLQSPTKRNIPSLFFLSETKI
jgi:hypothetical protein